MGKNLFKNFLIIFLLSAAVMAIFSLFNTSSGEPETVGISVVVDKIDQGQAKTVEISGNELTVTLNDGTKLRSVKEAADSMSSLVKDYGVSPEKLKKVEVTVKEDSGFAFWMSALLPFLLPLIVIGFFFWFMMRQVQGANTKAMSFGQSNVREQHAQRRGDRVTFNDVAGVKEAKEELKEIIDFLKTPGKFLALGARIPKGVLLIGSPGTGKTLLAKAVAGEANVPFFHISGSEFVEMFVGVGASRVRDLFRRAKRAAPCIVFVDEIDAVGRQRGAGLGGSHDEREQTLNQILVEMDGFETETNVIVMAATNRPDVLDPALLRPGRFDRRVILDDPDIQDREDILKVHARKKPFAQDVNLREVAERTPGFSGADLANVLNESALLAARRNRKQVTQADCLESIEKVMLGPERKSRIMSEREKKTIAYHEAGHALVAHMLPNTDPVHKISIISRGRAGGYTLKVPSEDRRIHTKTQFLEELAVLLAGQVSEQLVFHDTSTGPSSDLKQATQLAAQIVTQFGMSEKLGSRTYGDREELIFLGKEIHERRDYSEKTAQVIDQEVYRLIDDAHKTARRIIEKNRAYLDEIANRLMKKETLERTEFESIFKKQGATSSHA
ncbi:MAG: ATP-dependent zinc metalloprotease FtsH [Patescibacteria group bacterium]|nr:ATP-dependent zinc metalloprotease FtsH [Patescibacteria group bacterium]MDD5715528.1 ATP-dependent zinc metalloprotease FtsH [Patescibacteria group bacterium]